MTEEASASEKPKFSGNAQEWGYDLYPERKGSFTPSVIGMMAGTEGLEDYERLKCEKRVYKCYKTSKLVQLMLGALKASGCEIDLARHVVCEVCDPSVSGGYDPETNQIVICQNTSNKESIIQGILTHEMIHMFDYCNNKLDFRNIDHLACTEVRAANLTHCSFTSSMIQGNATPINFKNRHQECVKLKALQSILAVRKVSIEEAKAAIERVFPKCYNDLEPIGRRIKAASNDASKAHAEGFLYGYV
ncbi:mitochondrial inner membrane protease ATP23 homolog [Cimex lectularius]|uniref:Mitochondrial inner membrane protease ATP23 n=1 Tax=Cimex lectularius TaxID=79782 RepID=A0A8I6SH35_CIMLE|nr:mitochondrial inner membrane protease ATP23 homolog [Cimex lectularius]XP_024081558.1 mitochondrial inner membrane protease ATP23 homolog [Cimex lectularius]